MRLSTRACYGLRAAVDMAQNRAYPNGDSGRPASLSGISERQGVPIQYLRQIFLSLRRAGLVRSVRGRSGGYMLTRPLEDIAALDIISALEETLAPAPCMAASASCSRKSACPTKDLLDRLQSGILEMLSEASIAELAEANGSGGGALPEGYAFSI